MIKLYLIWLFFGKMICFERRQSCQNEQDPPKIWLIVFIESP